MNAHQKTFAESIEQWVRDDQGDRFERHPEPDQLAAYHAGSLSPNEDLEVQQHLLLCPECPDLLLDLEDLFEPRHRDLDLSDTWVSGAWRDLRAKLGNAQDSKRPFWRRWFSWLSGIPRPAYALATGLMVFLLVGSTVWLRQDLRRAVVPLGSIPTEIVRMESGTRGGNDEQKPLKATRIEFQPQQEGVRLGFRLGDETYHRIEATISEMVGKRMEPVHTVDNLEQTEANKANEARYARLTLLRASLDPGVYEISLKGFNGMEGTPLGKYHIRIVHL